MGVGAGAAKEGWAVLEQGRALGLLSPQKRAQTLAPDWKCWGPRTRVSFSGGVNAKLTRERTDCSSQSLGLSL